MQGIDGPESVLRNVRVDFAGSSASYPGAVFVRRARVDVRVALSRIDALEAVEVEAGLVTPEAAFVMMPPSASRSPGACVAVAEFVELYNTT